MKEVGKALYQVLDLTLQWLKDQLEKLGYLLKDVAEDIGKFCKEIAGQVMADATKVGEEIKKIADAVAKTCETEATKIVAALAENAQQAGAILQNLYGESLETINTLLRDHFPSHEVESAIRSLPGGDEFLDVLEDIGDALQIPK